MRQVGGIVLLATLVGVANAETLRFEAYELHADGARSLLAKGTKDYTPSADIVVLEARSKRGARHWSKRLPLFAKYELEADVYREPTLDGFGLVIDERDNPDGFSWNWFDRERGGVFVQRRGEGRIKVTEATVNGLVELASVEFLEDIVLRYTDHMGRHKPGEHTHEIVILKGSVFRVLGEAP